MKVRKLKKRKTGLYAPPNDNEELEIDIEKDNYYKDYVYLVVLIANLRRRELMKLGPIETQSKLRIPLTTNQNKEDQEETMISIDEAKT